MNFDKISLKFVPKGPINNIPALIRVMTLHRPGDKPLSEPMMARLLENICVTRPQWVNSLKLGHGPLTRYVNFGLHMRRVYRERFPRHQLQRKSLVSDPGIHRGTCVTHVLWCMSGSLTRGGGEVVPGACATRNFTYLLRGPWRSNYIPHKTVGVVTSPSPNLSKREPSCLTNAVCHVWVRCTFVNKELPS